MKDKFVIVNCTRRKSINPGVIERRLGVKPSFDIEREWEFREKAGDLLVKAIQLYRGKTFDVLRKYEHCVEVFILSGRYGLIHSDDYVLPYDAYLKNAPLDIFEKWSLYANWGLHRLKTRRWGLGVVCMSHVYLKALLKIVDLEELADDLIVITTKNVDLKKARLVVRPYPMLHVELDNALKVICETK